MPRVLVTAFEPFDAWKANSSWLTLVELTKDLPAGPELTTRLYPVDFAGLQQRLLEDLARGYDLVLHLGQATGSSFLRLETVALNLLETARPPAADSCRAVVCDGPLAYRSVLPAADLATELRQRGIPVQLSYHAGTYLCNAALYLSHHYYVSREEPTRSMLLHCPLDPSQVIDSPETLPSIPAATCAQAVRVILQRLASAERPDF